MMPGAKGHQLMNSMNCFKIKTRGWRKISLPAFPISSIRLSMHSSLNLADIAQSL
jgi:hypothetical protein